MRRLVVLKPADKTRYRPDETIACEVELEWVGGGMPTFLSIDFFADSKPTDKTRRGNSALMKRMLKISDNKCKFNAEIRAPKRVGRWYLFFRAQDLLIQLDDQGERVYPPISKDTVSAPVELIVK